LSDDAELPNIVAIKYSVPRHMYVQLTRMAGDKIQVSTASEAEWFDNIVELRWRLYLCSSPPYLYQTKCDRRMRDYTDFAFKGEVARAKAICDSLERCAKRFAARGRPRSLPLTRNTGKSCSGRRADRCARQYSN
jgi:4-hydroxy-tetrahydrodipicolinate synthase